MRPRPRKVEAVAARLVAVAVHSGVGAVRECLGPMDVGLGFSLSVEGSPKVFSDALSGGVVHTLDYTPQIVALGRNLGQKGGALRGRVDAVGRHGLVQRIDIAVCRGAGMGQIKRNWSAVTGAGGVSTTVPSRTVAPPRSLLA